MSVTDDEAGVNVCNRSSMIRWENVSMSGDEAGECECDW
jgi:hypothetical protein